MKNTRVGYLRGGERVIPANKITAKNFSTLGFSTSNRVRNDMNDAELNELRKKAAEGDAEAAKKLHELHELPPPAWTKGSSK